MKNRMMFKGRLISLFKKELRLPNGCVTEIEIIKHPGAVLIIPFLSSDRVVMLRQFRPAINSYIYELPAGTLKQKELLISCARREVIEETGFRAKRFVKLGSIYPVPGYSTEKITIYKATGLVKQKRDFDEDEIIEDFIASRRLVKKLFKASKIVDAKTICAFAMCGWL